MDTTALLGLLDSISEWEQKLSVGIVNPEQVKLGRSACPLCRLYNASDDRTCACVGCPIFSHTSLRCCRGTPYSACDSSLRELHKTINPLNQSTNTQFGSGLNEWLLNEWKRNAQAMIDFMKKLVPADCNPKDDSCG